MLFDEIIFGPIKSRRLGNSLGINLLPTNGKLCSFDCIYCECGFNFVNKTAKMSTKEQIISLLSLKIKDFLAKGEKIDTITFAGNGEPTMHPDFLQIVKNVIEIRDNLCKHAKISVLSNALHCGKKTVFDALNLVDNNILKLDSGIEETIKLINRPNSNFSLHALVENLQKFNGNLIIQTLFFSGRFNDKKFDNTTENEIVAWLELLKKIKPEMVMIYSLDRPTPVENLQKTSFETLQKIAQRVENEGITTQIN
ncbi:MAG: radical SAM protein [Prevotellaceae bacterium]|jgi:wyosine [tRNA(Phe)-imidazoG37] synthetase (radical SAM superfamily)|nr:radical SAM protein [Prevotellaceae bacterium]